MPTRWVDRGQFRLCRFLKVSSRYYSGLLEVLYTEQISDRTQWQRMLKGQVEEMDLVQKQQELYEHFSDSVREMAAGLPENAIVRLKTKP